MMKMFSLVNICSPLTLGGHNLCMSSQIIYTKATASPALLEEEVCSHGKADARKHLHHPSGSTEHLPLPNSSCGECGDTLFCRIHRVLYPKTMCFILFPDFSEISSAPQRQSTEWQLLIVLDFVTKPCHQDSSTSRPAHCRTPPTAGSAGGPVLHAAAPPSQTWCLSFGLSATSNRAICMWVAAFCRDWVVSPMLNNSISRTILP